MSIKNGELEFIAIDRPRVLEKRKRRRKNKTIKRGIFLAVLFFVGVITAERAWTISKSFLSPDVKSFLQEYAQKDDYPEELLELLEKNEETLDFVKNYPKRETYQSQSVDLSGDYVRGEVPLLMQWDKRWGYDRYGNGMIALEGCGPLCLTMAYLYFTGDTEMNPRRMAAFAYENGYYSAEGTRWSLWTEGVSQLGLTGENLSLCEDVMKQTLDNGGVIVCSMRPGDFTTTGHFILIRGYDEHGFFVNDPNRRSNSEKQWDYDTLEGQIKNLWGLFIV